ncbi:MAG TPA: ATP-binding cassette domain-containing protein [Negativicutes bacterium]|nr:ATP-binding cassette domain-containing protein [Negativicutes bacterium]
MLSVSRLTKEFILHLMGGKVITACREISFSVARGELLAIVGPSGSGKSTIVKCIYQNYEPTSGDITYFRGGDREAVNLGKADTEAMLALRNKDIGYVPQHFTVIPRVPVLDITAEPMLKVGLEKEEAYRKAGEYLEEIGINKQLFDVYPAILSGGQKQRINILRAVVREPDLLLVDEPTASLDVESAEIVENLLMSLKKKGTTIIGVFHDPRMVKRIADKVLHVRDGRVVARDGMDSSTN